jgi:hypothetical protein
VEEPEALVERSRERLRRATIGKASAGRIRVFPHRDAPVAQPQSHPIPVGFPERAASGTTSPAGEPATVLEGEQQGVQMIHRVRWLSAALVAAALVAACGGGGHSSTTTTSTTKVARTTTSKTTSTTKTTTSTTAGVPNKAQVLADCKREAKTYTTTFGSILPGHFQSDVDSICQKIAAGNISGAKAVARALCNQVVSEMPSGQAKSAIQSACKSIS